MNIYNDSWNNEAHVQAPLTWVRLVSEHQPRFAVLEDSGESLRTKYPLLLNFLIEIFIITVAISSHFLDQSLQGKPQVYYLLAMLNCLLLVPRSMIENWILYTWEKP